MEIKKSNQERLNDLKSRLEAQISTIKNRIGSGQQTQAQRPRAYEAYRESQAQQKSPYRGSLTGPRHVVGSFVSSNEGRYGEIGQTSPPRLQHYSDLSYFRTISPKLSEKSNSPGHQFKYNADAFYKKLPSPKSQPNPRPQLSYSKSADKPLFSSTFARSNRKLQEIMSLEQIIKCREIINEMSTVEYNQLSAVYTEELLKMAKAIDNITVGNSYYVSRRDNGLVR